MCFNLGNSSRKKEDLVVLSIALEVNRALKQMLGNLLVIIRIFKMILKNSVDSSSQELGFESRSGNFFTQLKEIQLLGSN